ncbi:MAG: OmpA family protein [Bacteroidales bacterium]|jgi:outer membrane protein OmpA-like peptidoglycan-associated protein|nr:OmpA family protein [Bacteroidales bacterium]
MKRILIISMALVFAASLNAQNETQKIRWKNYTPNGFWSNWEISAGVGANVFLKFDNKFGNPDFENLAKLSFSLSVNKWFNPIVGARINFQGPVAAAIDVDGQYNRFKFMFVHYDQLWNLTNWICGYKVDRLYNAVVTTGMGYAINFDKDNSEYALTLGLQNRFRLCDAWNLDLELQSMLTKSNFDQTDNAHSLANGGWSRFATSIAAYVGVTYKLPTRNWQPLPQCKQDDNCAKRVSDLEKDNNNYKKALQDVSDKNNQLQKELNNARNAAKDESKPTTVPINEQVSFTIFFNGNEGTLTDEAKTNINTIVELLKKTDNNTKYIITGYADKETGDSKSNMELSKKRAETVKKALVKAGIDEGRLKTAYKGDTVQPLGNGSINRCVIILQEK